MTQYKLIQRDVVDEPIVVVVLKAKTARGARRAAANYLKDHKVDGIVQVGYIRDDGLMGNFEIDDARA